ncbi:hypothetical protein EIP91_009131 [Steccherinum ochraceum]|uniref:F-box domain-containing protein n=1 Tax=Steccherinum ochraceum TaxID=92696 RepID=A0A4R0R4Q0_9APHY|nr:hypothetical protein EIP91_009131 [Steccherinum ochraceum]
MDFTSFDFPALVDERTLSTTPSSSLGRQLPIEICEMIIDVIGGILQQKYTTELVNAQGDREVLRSCMQVCRAWVPRCQFHLMATVRFQSRISITSFTRLVRRTPELRDRVKRAVIKVSNKDDQSWVSCIPFVLPVQLESLRLSGVDLSVLHPTCTRQFGLMKVRDLTFNNINYTRYSQVALFASTSLQKVYWEAVGYLPINSGSVPRKQTALKDIHIDVQSLGQIVSLLRDFVVSSSNPLDVFFVVSPAAFRHADPVGGLGPHRDPALTVVGLPKPTFGGFPEEDKALWRCGRSFDAGPSILEVNIRRVDGGLAVYASGVISFLSSLGFREIKIDFHFGGGEISDRSSFKPLDDALSDPSFANLVRVTLDPSFIHSQVPVSCHLDFAPTLFPRTYARGLIEPADECEWPKCEVHNPQPINSDFEIKQNTYQASVFAVHGRT